MPFILTAQRDWGLGAVGSGTSTVLQRLAAWKCWRRSWRRDVCQAAPTRVGASTGPLMEPDAPDAVQ